MLYTIIRYRYKGYSLALMHGLIEFSLLSLLESVNSSVISGLRPKGKDRRDERGREGLTDCDCQQQSGLQPLTSHISSSLSPSSPNKSLSSSAPTVE